MLLPAYKLERARASKSRSGKGQSLDQLRAYIRSPPMRRLVLLLLFLPIPIICFFLGRMSRLGGVGGGGGGSAGGVGEGSFGLRKPVKLDTFSGRAFTREETNSSLLSQSQSHWDKWAFALKTGRDVALKRTPIQLMTFLAPVRNIILIGDAPDVYVGEIPMVDVISSLPTSTNEGYVSPPQMKHDAEYIAAPSSPKQKRLAEEVVPDENARGWKSDAKKNIPGFKELHRRYPDADWYFMIDDDTYVFMDNLKRMLDKLDPALPHYMGAATNFVGCDGVLEWGKSIYFAHGGAGIVVSRGAMQKILPLLDSCLEKYDTCWAGDIRWGMCMRDAGVLIEHAPLFSPNAPNDHYNWVDPCAEPRTFHHLLSSQIQKLFELEQVAKQQTQILILEDVFKAFMSDAAQVDLDRPGGNYLKNVPGLTAEECKKACEKTPKCFTYISIEKDCHMKASVPPLKRGFGGMISGLAVDNFRCKIKWF